ncbi:enoyl-CoA hydratase/isomerase family protein [Pseudofrankia inefficax]|uniref:Enoyl-CoA hydratase/isomerase n=1 Tax=Pseudofrankia inefficax (strain DSM 45817 / CECT 9037 / DDB 130130 / EuI1c) TaxID=298654 RepID=E3JAQ3_PSEI1|nr:enoyl-CoA hydratase/isomerase family protein [Pseudofrankia inefficax]ADP83391.1 Enoyl-CoA hydratase/isomerase [Pseudofrankia inefficax]
MSDNLYDLPDEVQVRADGPIRIITLNRPDNLNAVNHDLHVGLARLWTQLNEDLGARAAVITGAGRAFSAGGDFAYLNVLRQDPELQKLTIMHGRDIILGMLRCRLPVVAAVNGPAAGLGCSLVGLSDIVYIAEKAYLLDPHVQVGLVAADGGPLVWPMNTSMHWVKEYAITGKRISAEKALEMGLANHIVADPVAEALECAKSIAALPQQAVEATKRLLNLQLEKNVLASLDYANYAEQVSFTTDDFAAIMAKLTAKKS